MNKNNIMKTLMITIMIVLIYCPIAYCAESGTTRIKIDNSGTWLNINVSESYEECESLNSTNSTLGTAALKAHLTTDYDWSAMAILSTSQYGAATTNTPTTTTNNKSGIYDLHVYSQTTTLMNTTTPTATPYVYGLYDENGNLKEYVNKINPTTGEDQLGRTAISCIVDGGTRSWLGSSPSSAFTNKATSVAIKLGLFGYSWGGSNMAAAYDTVASGRPGSDVTFRPVIWNH